MLRYLSSLLLHAYNCLPNIRGRYRFGRWLDAIGPHAFKAPSGIWLKGFLSSTNDNAFVRNKIENELLYQEIQKLPEDAVFIDIGANAGFYSALVAKRLGQDGLVLSIDPSPREYARLLWAREHNAHECRWICLNEGASFESSTLELQVHSNHTGMNSFAGKEMNATSITVPVRTMDSMALQLPDLYEGRPIDLMKIDVEGWEPQVLQGCNMLLERKLILKLIVEITPDWLKQNGSSKEELYAYLKAFKLMPTISSDSWQYDELFELSLDN